MQSRKPNVHERLARKFRKELNAGTVSLMLLALLTSSERAMYGYEIARLLEEKAEPPPVKHGTLYPVLRSLERQGLLSSRTRASAAGPPRKYYRVSRAGRRALASWTETWAATRALVDELLEPGGDAGSRRRVS